MGASLMLLRIIRIVDDGHLKPHIRHGLLRPVAASPSISRASR